MVNDPGPAPAVDPANPKVMLSRVGVSCEKLKLPETPEFAPQAGGTMVLPTQKPGLAGSVCTVGPPNGVITVFPVSDDVKLYVLPTIVALAAGATTKEKAATM